MAKTPPRRAKTPPRRAKTPPRRAKTAPRRAKTAPSPATTAQPRYISNQTILSILRQLFDPNGNRPVVLDAPIENYIKGGRPAVRAFFAPLNRAFKSFGLNLKPGDLANVETVKDLVAVIVKWFTNHGYQVTL